MKIPIGSKLDRTFGRPSSGGYIVFHILAGSVQTSSKVVEVGFFDPATVEIRHKEHRQRALTATARQRNAEDGAPWT